MAETKKRMEEKKGEQWVKVGDGAGGAEMIIGIEGEGGRCGEGF